MKDKTQEDRFEAKPKVRVYAFMKGSRTNQFEEIGEGELSIMGDEDDQEGGGYYLSVSNVEKGEFLVSYLALTNNYDKQKGSIIVWEDPTKQQCEQIGISFEKEDICQFYWRLICQRIGKSHLEYTMDQQINYSHQEINDLYMSYYNGKITRFQYRDALLKLHMPSVFKVIFKQFPLHESIIASMIDLLDIKATELMCSSKNFTYFLQYYSKRESVPYQDIYDQFAVIKSFVTISPETKQKIEIYHNARFYKDYFMILHQNFEIIEGIISWIIKDKQSEIFSYFVREDKIRQAMNQHSKYSNQIKINEHHMNSQQQKQSENKQMIAEFDPEAKKVDMLLELFVLFQKSLSDSSKKKFIDQIYAEKVLLFLDKYCQKNDNIKALQLIQLISTADPFRFINFLKLNFRQNPANNLHRNLAEIYAKGRYDAQQQVLHILESFGSAVVSKKQLMDFFNGTFFCYCFESSEDIPRILQLVNFIVSRPDVTLLNIFPLFSKYRLFTNILCYFSQRKINSKKLDLLFIKILKNIFLELKQKYTESKTEQWKNICRELVQTGCISYSFELLRKNLGKYNLILSSLLENIQILSSIHFCPIHEFVQQNYREDGELEKVVKTIMKVKRVEIKMVEMAEEPAHKKHNEELQNQQQQNYLMSQNQFQLNNSQNEENKILTGENEQIALNQIKALSEEIHNFEKEEDFDQPKKKVKANENFSNQVQDLSFSFEFQNS